MRRILVERARSKRRLRHGGGRDRVDLDDVEIEADRKSDDLLALNEALDKLELKDPVKTQLVKLRYFAGLTVEEAARALGISRTTANEAWAYARAWLFREIRKGDDHRSG